MNSSCFLHRHIRYSKRRSDSFVQCRRGTQTLAKPLLELRCSSIAYTYQHHYARQLHISTPLRRKRVKDLQRTARYQAAQHDLKTTTQEEDQPSDSQTINDRPPWNPYSKDGLQDLHNLFEGLATLAKNGQADSESEGAVHKSTTKISSATITRSQTQQLQSPLEKRLPWDREKKLRVHEVEADTRLENNVWAQILASPMRLDRGTKARIPRDLMTGFGIMMNPKDQRNYMLPIELADIEALKRELRQEQNAMIATETVTESSPSLDQAHPPRPTSTSPTPGTRIQLQTNKSLIQAMTEEFMYKSGSTGEIEFVSSRTNSGKISSSLIPQRWRHKQREMEAFHRTRVKFNQALGREMDGDEPDLKQLPALDKLLWQPDLAGRMERIMRERIGIALDAVRRDNALGHEDGRSDLVTMDVPEHGILHVNEDGQLCFANPSKPYTNQKRGLDPDETSVPEWIHGTIFVHIGPPNTYRNTVERWHHHTTLQHQINPTRRLPPLPSDNLLPPLITVTDNYRLPVFNLESLFGPEESSRINEILSPFMVLKPHMTAVQSSPSSPIRPYLVMIKPGARHAFILAREIWQLWRYIGGREGLYLG